MSDLNYDLRLTRCTLTSLCYLNAYKAPKNSDSRRFVQMKFIVFAINFLGISEI